jgi:hypothetical protein
MPTIARMPVSGETPTTLVHLPDFLGSLLVVGGYVYFTLPNGSNVLILRVPVTAQAPGFDAGLTMEGGTTTDAGDAGGTSGVPSGAQLVASTTLTWGPAGSGQLLSVAR